MKLIKNNPYRTVGLLVGATAREQDRQIKRLIKFISAEQEPEDDYSFPVLGEIDRTVESVNDAVSKLNLNEDKMKAALFWFWKGNSITDEAAFDALREGNVDGALQIWIKMIITTKEGKKLWKPVTEKNLSAFHNCFILSMLKQKANLHNAVISNLFFLESDLIFDFIYSATDQTYKTSKKDLQLFFLDKLLEEKDIQQEKLFEALDKYSFSAKKDFIALVTQKLVVQVEEKIENAKKQRKKNKKNAYNIGKELYNTSIENHAKLKVYLGADNPKYEIVIDKLANEILQCGIDYFNYHHEEGDRPRHLDLAMSLAKLAKSIAVGKLTDDRINESIDTLNGMKDIEISQAIILLQSVKDAYEKNKAEIMAEVKKQEAGLARNVYIDWVKVNDVIEKSIEWDKVVELILKTIPPQNIRWIKDNNSSAKIEKYKNLVEFIIEKLNNAQRNKVSYICYWKQVSKSVALSAEKNLNQNTNAGNTPSNWESFDFMTNTWWILPILGGLLGWLVEPGGNVILGAVLGLFAYRFFEHPWALIFPGAGALIGLMGSSEAAAEGALFGGLIGGAIGFLILSKID